MRNIIFAAFIMVILAVGLLMRRNYVTSDLKNGNSAPEITGVNHLGQSIKLSDYLGEYILLDFWGSWCAPCRKELPMLKDLQSKYATSEFVDAEGFQVFSVGIETNSERWKSAIDREQMSWEAHVSSFRRFEEPAAVAYDVKYIPSYFLIGPDGKIKLVNVTLDQIDSFLGKKVGS